MLLLKFAYYIIIKLGHYSILGKYNNQEKKTNIIQKSHRSEIAINFVVHLLGPPFTYIRLRQVLDFNENALRGLPLKIVSGFREKFCRIISVFNVGN